MPVDERQRRALVRAAADSWGEEVAATLSELLPSTGSRPATQADVEGVAGLGGDVQALTERIDGIVHQVSADAERRFTDLVTAQTRSLMLSLFGTVVVIAALAFGLH